MVIKNESGLRFELRSRIMREDPKQGTDPYSATRADVKKVFQEKITAIIYKIGPQLMRSFPANIELNDRSIRIGCCEFRGRNFTALRKWALGVK